MSKLWAFVRHNQGMFVSAILSIAVVAWTYGCESQVTSIVYAPNRVTRGELQIEVETFMAQAKLKFENLDKQDQIKSTIFNTVLEFAQGGKVNPAAVAIVIGNILGLGAILDNVKKRTLIATLKNNVAASPPPV